MYGNAKTSFVRATHRKDPQKEARCREAIKIKETPMDMMSTGANVFSTSIKTTKIKQWKWGCDSGNTLKATELYNFSG